VSRLDRPALVRGLTRVTDGALGPYQTAVIRIGFAWTWLLFLLRELPHRRELYGPDGPWSWDMAHQLISGNHESDGLNGNINDFSACLPNQLPGVVGTYGRQYYVDVPQGAPLVRFIGISPGLVYSDGAWTYTAGSPRYQRRASDVQSAPAARNSIAACRTPKTPMGSDTTPAATAKIVVITRAARSPRRA